ncbi:MAG: hypothetical protein QXX95_07510 [Nitrososphaerales archaeon]
MKLVKVKTSVYVDKELWEKYKSSVARKGLEVSKALEELIEEEVPEEILERVVKNLEEKYEIDFEPVKPIEGLVSTYVRTMRD